MTAVEAFRAGRFNEARALLERVDGDDPCFAVMLAETLYAQGHSTRSRAIVESVLKRVSDHTVASRCLSLLAAHERDGGKLEVSVRFCRQALDAAIRGDSEYQIAVTSIELMERSCDRQGFSASLPLLFAARRATVRSADAHSTSRLHISLGRLEGRAGNFGRARRHFDLGRRVLRLEPNGWLDAAVDIDESSVLTLLGDVPGAIELATRGAAAAISSGWSKGSLVASANLAYLLVSTGQLAAAEAQIGIAEAQTFRSSVYDLVIADTRAQIAICRGDFEAAEKLLRQTMPRCGPFGAWYELAVQHTLVRVLLLQGRLVEAKHQAVISSGLAAVSGNRLFVQAFRQCEAEATAEADGASDPPISTLLESAEDWPLTLLGGMYLVLGKRFSAEGHRARAALLARRAQRILAFAASKPMERAADLAVGRFGDGSVSERSQRDDAPSDLDKAVALLELAGHPHILGHEAIAILNDAGCCERMALVATGAPAGPRVIVTEGWTGPQALAALAEAPTEDLSILGQHRDEMWQILARSRPELAHQCTLATVRRLIATARTLDQYRQEERQRAALWPAESFDDDPESIWASERSAELLSSARRIACNPLPVLITGETGTGKEMLARVVHRASDRADRPLQPFNCSAVPRDMLESQLFGYRRGAFTGAESAFPGVIRAAAGGTLFLDEIAEVSLDLQPKLLRFLDSQEIHPLGEPHPIKVDVRIISATNANVEQMVANGRFREDLFYRLNVIRLRIPPLRDRREEIPPLVQFYLRRFSEEQRKGRLSIDDEVLEYLVLYHWAGNLRQLSNEVRRLVAFADRDSVITAPLLSPEILASRRTIAVPAGQPEIRLRLDQPLPEAVEQLEQTMVRRALERADGRVEEAARLLGISRKGLFLKRRRWGRPAPS